MDCDLRHQPAEILAVLLTDLGVGSVPLDTDDPKQRVWPVHFGDEPPDPDNSITVYSTTSTLDGQSPHDGDLWERPGWQIRVRCRTKEEGHAKANEIKVAIAGIYWQTINVVDTVGSSVELTPYRVETMLPSGGINDIGPEQVSERYLFTLNGTCTITPNP